jgi:DNA-binding NarL/FixJ family response regulator
MSHVAKIVKLRRFLSENPAFAGVPVAIIGGRPVTLREAVEMLERGENVSEIIQALNKLGLNPDEEELWILAEKFWESVAAARPDIRIYMLGGLVPAMSPAEALEHIRARDEVGKVLVKAYKSMLAFIRARMGT